MRLDEAVFDRVAAGADVLPAGEIFAVEQRLPVRFLGIGRRRRKKLRQQVRELRDPRVICAYAGSSFARTQARVPTLL